MAHVDSEGPDARPRRKLTPRTCAHAHETPRAASCGRGVADRVEQLRVASLDVHTKAFARACRVGFRRGRDRFDCFGLSRCVAGRGCKTCPYLFRSWYTFSDGDNVLTSRASATQRGALVERSASIERPRELVTPIRAAPGRTPSPRRAWRRGVRRSPARAADFRPIFLVFLVFRNVASEQPGYMYQPV